MTELEELLEQKKEIDRRIRDLKNTATVVGLVKIERKRPSGYKWKPEYWHLSVLVRGRWRPLYKHENRDEVVNIIPEISHDLIRMYERMTKE